MKHSIKIFSLFLVFISLFSCDISDDDDVISYPELKASYTYIREGAKITFINTSSNADSYLWDFGDNSTSSSKEPVKTFTQTGDYIVKLTAKNTKTGETKTFSSTISLFIFDGGLITNGNFENGILSWNFGVDNPMPSSWLVTENGNTFASINVASAGQPFDVNLSQKGLNMTTGITYRLTFDAWSDVNRQIIVGIGLSAGPWTNQTVVKDLTTEIQSFSIDLEANFTSPNSRVIFDLGAAVGKVNIDNVTLIELP
ncbi:PKD domain-containing protein [Flavobacterium sp.]|uniref:PKD domain-containing protein n=1 Tax=Flavobacterium sp. TaxID=239 RepID=UPI003527E4FA